MNTRSVSFLCDYLGLLTVEAEWGVLLLLLHIHGKMLGVLDLHK